MYLILAGADSGFQGWGGGGESYSYDPQGHTHTAQLHALGKFRSFVGGGGGCLKKLLEEGETLGKAPPLSNNRLPRKFLSN